MLNLKPIAPSKEKQDIQLLLQSNKCCCCSLQIGLIIGCIIMIVLGVFGIIGITAILVGVGKESRITDQWQMIVFVIDTIVVVVGAAIHVFGIYTICAGKRKLVTAVNHLLTGYIIMNKIKIIGICIISKNAMIITYYVMVFCIYIVIDYVILLTLKKVIAMMDVVKQDRHANLQIEEV